MLANHQEIVLRSCVCVPVCLYVCVCVCVSVFFVYVRETLQYVTVSVSVRRCGSTILKRVNITGVQAVTFLLMRYVTLYCFLEPSFFPTLTHTHTHTHTHTVHYIWISERFSLLIQCYVNMKLDHVFQSAFVD